MPKPNCYYNMTESVIQPELEQPLFVMPVFKIFGKKSQSQLLCTLVNRSPNEIVLPKHRPWQDKTTQCL